MGWVVALGVINILLGGLSVCLYIDNRNYRKTNRRIGKRYREVRKAFSEYVAGMNEFMTSLQAALEPERKKTLMEIVEDREYEQEMV